MKKGFLVKAIMCMAIIAGCTSFASGDKTASAEQAGKLSIKEVSDIDNVPFPTVSYVTFTGNYDRYFSEFTISTPGRVKSLVQCGDTIKGTGKIWVSRDLEGKDIIGSISELIAGTNYDSWFLESGRYYLNCSWSSWTDTIGIALLHETSPTQETIAVSDFTNSTVLPLNTAVKGFLSSTVPNDYYNFLVEKKANVTLEYTFDTTDNASGSIGLCTLYDSNHQVITHGSYTMNDRGTLKINYLLQPGNYYVKLNGLLGDTTLKVKPMYYNITLTSKKPTGWTDEPINISIDTTIDYSDIMVMNFNVDTTAIGNASVWVSTNENSVKLKGETFAAAKNGIYTVRITDKFGNHTMKKIKVSNIDITRPKIYGVKNDKAYNKAVKLIWTDKQSGIDPVKTTLNGKKVSSGITVKKEGKYTLRVYDKVGNYRKLVFYVDYTAPIAGIKSGVTYDDYVTLNIKDAVSGMKKIIVNDSEKSLYYTTINCFLDGDYVIKLWDKAGNYRKIVFSIKRAKTTQTDNVTEE